MRHIVRFTRDETRPGRPEILGRMHVAPGAAVSPRLSALVDEARRLFDRLTAPAAIFEEISREEFAHIYADEGHNPPASPLDAIVPRAEAIALFAGTLGPAIDEAIRERFREGDVALGCMLDVFASGAADRLADLAASRFLAVMDRRPPALCALPYSPGYCGWDVSGQTRLFERLRPGEIGIVLSESCLMQPIKSVSGVLVAGAVEIHRFKPTYPFCATCATHDCRRRMRAAGKAREPWRP